MGGRLFGRTGLGVDSNLFSGEVLVGCQLQKIYIGGQVMFGTQSEALQSRSGVMFCNLSHAVLGSYSMKLPVSCS